jgi:hypothetical protein
LGSVITLFYFVGFGLRCGPRHQDKIAITTVWLVADPQDRSREATAPDQAAHQVEAMLRHDQSVGILDVSRQSQERVQQGGFLTIIGRPRLDRRRLGSSKH